PARKRGYCVDRLVANQFDNQDCPVRCEHDRNDIRQMHLDESVEPLEVPLTLFDFQKMLIRPIHHSGRRCRKWQISYDGLVLNYQLCPSCYENRKLADYVRHSSPAHAY